MLESEEKNEKNVCLEPWIEFFVPLRRDATVISVEVNEIERFAPG